MKQFQKLLVITAFIFLVITAFIFFGYQMSAEQVNRDALKNEIGLNDVEAILKENVINNDNVISDAIDLSAFISLTWQSGAPKKTQNIPLWKASLAQRIGSCGFRDLVFRNLLKSKYKKLKSGRVNFFNVPIQRNHSASFIIIDGREVFFDATTGVYFTDDDGKILSIQQARQDFPDIFINYVDRKKGTLLRNSALSEEDISWSVITGDELLASPLYVHYKGRGKKAVISADVLRTYFLSNTDRDNPTSEMRVSAPTIHERTGDDFFNLKNNSKLNTANYFVARGNNNFPEKRFVIRLNSHWDGKEEIQCCDIQSITFRGTDLDDVEFDYDDFARISNSPKRLLPNTSQEFLKPPYRNFVFQSELRNNNTELEIWFARSNAGGEVTLYPTGSRSSLHAMKFSKILPVKLSEN